MLVRDLLVDVAREDVESFRQNGFHIIPTCIFTDRTHVAKFNEHLENIVNGTFDLGKAPYKIGKPPHIFKKNGAFSFTSLSASSGSGSRLSTIHGINAWMCDSLFQRLVFSESITEAVVKFMGWEQFGCRLAQDQVWIKPPQSGPLTYHRDSPYLDFTPQEVCTVWIPFDETYEENVGTLEYCVGSHRWTSDVRGSASQFFNRDYTELLRIAAQHEKENVETESDTTAKELHIVKVLGESGCCSFHNGRTWHGSGCNTTSGWRRGVGIHYVRGDSVLTSPCGTLWKNLLERGTFDECFPLVAKASSQIT